MSVIRPNFYYWDSRALDSDFTGTRRQERAKWWWPSDDGEGKMSFWRSSDVEEIPTKDEIEEVPTSTALYAPDLYRGATLGDIKLFEDMFGDEQGIARVVNFITVRKDTVLHVAASFGKIQIVELVHKQCPSLVMSTNIRRDTALHLAARYGHLSVVRFLIKYFIGDIETGNVEVSEGLLRMKNVDGNTALHEATRNGHEGIALLLSNQDHESANFVNNNGESPFYLAAEAGLLMLVRELLLMPLDHMIQEKHEGKTALHAAIAQVHIEIVKILLEQRPKLQDCRDNHGRSPMHYAAYSGYHQAVTVLLNYDDGSIAHQRDKDGMSPIHFASISGHLRVFEQLLRRRPDIADPLNDKFQNALHVACASGRVNMTTYMLRTPELENLINENDIDGNTALHLATRNGHATIVSLLVRDKRVDLTIENGDGLTAYEVAQTQATSFQELLCAVVLKFASAPNLKRRRHSLIKRQVQDEKTPLKSLRERISTLVLVATLIITITFAAGLVVPGGDTGKEKTSQILNCAFHVYVISNTIAMYSSIAVAVMLIWGHLGDPHLLNFALRWSMLILAVALAMLAVAFAAGVCLVVRKFVWLATAVLVMSFVFLLCILALFLPLEARVVARYRWIEFMSNITSNYLLHYIVYSLSAKPRPHKPQITTP